MAVLQSMTGFARAHGSCGASDWAWELKSVNAKGLDLRLRLPPGFDALESPCRQLLSARLARGTVFASLTVKRSGASPSVVINETVLNQVMEAARLVAARLGAAPVSVDGLLALRGVVDVVEPTESEDEHAEVEQAVRAGLETALAALIAMRADEGAALERLLIARLDEIDALKQAAEANPARSVEAIRTRIGEQVQALLANSAAFDTDRLHQEALLLASKADIREELDRLAAHTAASRQLLKAGGAIGRKLDFLAQEFNRETNTLCSKSNDVSLTATGLELKAVVEQFREQVQNLE